MNGRYKYPPKASPPKARMARALKEAAMEPNHAQDIADEIEAAAFFDFDAPSTRSKRKNTRAHFELFVEANYKTNGIEDIWSASTIIDYTKGFLLEMARLSQGNLGPRITPATLWAHKDALYWWASLIIPDFTSSLPEWNREVNTWIQYLGHQYHLETSHRPKNNLGEEELNMFFEHLFTLHTGVENWKQHYVLWVLAYITAMRPGSVTVAKGYEAGASLGGNGLTRITDETLRWEDVTFFRLDGFDGIGVRIVFKYLKGYRNPYARDRGFTQKTFTFIPTRGKRCHFDVSALIIALAHTRGLFPYGSLEELHTSDKDRVNVPTVPSVSRQAVFIASTNMGTLEADIPMRVANINEKLQQMCTFVGLFDRNTLYSFRRTAIIETYHTLGLDTARQLAGHVHGSQTISRYYDNRDMSNTDVNALRLREKPIPEMCIAKIFTQARTAGLPQETRDHKGPNQILEERTTLAMESDDGYREMERELDRCLVENALVLNIAPLTNVRGVFNRYRALLQEGNHVEAIGRLDNIIARRKAVRRMLRRQHSLQQHEQMREENRKDATVRGVEPTEIRPHTSANASETVKQAQNTDIDEDAFDDVDHPDDDILDTRAVEEATESDRNEPETWRDFPDNVFAPPPGAGEGTGSFSQRMAFMNDFAGLASVATSGIQCILCGLDMTATASDKARLWDLNKFDRHVSGTFHTRKMQISRAAGNSMVNGNVTCPLCQKTMERKAIWKHVLKEHPEQAI